MSTASLSASSVSHDEIVAALEEIALRQRLMGRNRYAAKAYAEAARTIDGIRPDRLTMLRVGALEAMQSIGKKTAAEIRALVRDGRSPRLEGLRQVPGSVLEMTAVAGLAIDDALHLFEEYGIDGIPALLRQLQEGDLGESDLRAKVDGAARSGDSSWSEGATQDAATGKRRKRGSAKKGADSAPLSLETLRSALEAYEQSPAPLRYPVALSLAGALQRGFTQAHLRSDVVGAIRRGEEEVPHLELLVESDARRCALVVESLPQVSRLVSEEGEVPLRARLLDGTLAVVHVTDAAGWGAALLQTTGPNEHAAEVLSAVSEVPADEPSIYAAAHRPFVPPEIRDEPELSQAPPRLVELSDIQGMIHCHTTFSDGKHSVEAMALAAEERGYRYLTITDHSQTAHYAKGLAIEAMKKQWEIIDQVQEKVSIRLLKGIESDILKDGSLDYPDSILEQLDVVIASIHSRYRQDEDAMTARIIAALRHPCFKIWGHPLGRLLLGRAPVPCRLEEILDVAAESRCALEINGDPHRLDLPAEHVRSARKRGIPFVISSDAHSTRTYRYVEWSVGVARRGGLSAHQVLNTLPADEFAVRVRPFD